MANVLAGDIGGTTTRLGVFEPAASRPRILATRTYGTTEFGGIAGIVSDFLRNAGVDARSIGAACFGAAGPVIDGVAQLTNARSEDASAIARTPASRACRCSTISRP
jgi:glucokinase